MPDDIWVKLTRAEAETLIYDTAALDSLDRRTAKTKLWDALQGRQQVDPRVHVDLHVHGTVSPENVEEITQFVIERLEREGRI